MRGADHYRAAERLLNDHPADDTVALARAQVHATLALAAATAYPAVADWLGDENRSGSDWTAATS